MNFQRHSEGVGASRGKIQRKYEYGLRLDSIVLYRSLCINRHGSVPDCLHLHVLCEWDVSRGNGMCVS